MYYQPWICFEFRGWSSIHSFNMLQKQ
ncbi:2-oxoglutarate (2OG) and Fe(II)-dependent oxygenase superfamily protein [Zea mays]|uniref:2-oxoglutarate (2OG) and Fe(II)-dependent oxygenase superfamily protein n=1 Tax=Zea mays TaxID=4577 RepID=A0A1D6EW76_MAIZE|nr:2-oxoglutarate (2OG) and Fe(II)-dependent oxygenase superfamily protein [Zea mays]